MSRLGPYEVLSVLGDGGMGTVHRGRDPRFDRPVAIKVLHSQYARDPEVSERFRTEAVIQAKLNHPNIVTVYDFLAEGDQLAMVMELVEGQTLAELIAAHPQGLAEATVVTVMSQVLSAVGFAHGKGLVHRDLKPSNVMVQDLGDGELVAKVMDFGIAKILGAEKMRTATSAKMGTLAYMSPEQLRSPKSVDHRSDLYSLGAMLYEMLTGRVPYDADTEYELMRKAIEEEPPAPSRVVPNLSSRWDAIVARAMAKEPERRCESAGELRAWLSGSGAESKRGSGDTDPSKWIGLASSPHAVSPGGGASSGGSPGRGANAFPRREGGGRVSEQSEELPVESATQLGRVFRGILGTLFVGCGGFALFSGLANGDDVMQIASVVLLVLGVATILSE